MPFPYSLHPEMPDELFMVEALKEAWKGWKSEEVPIGAIVVYQGEIIARAHNETERRQDATAHAEMLCLRSAQKLLGSRRLKEAIVYSTLEPCSMCAGAMLLTRISRLVWGAPDIRHGAHGSWINMLEIKHPCHTLSVSQGIYQEVSADLLRTFFRQRRLEKRAGKVLP